MKKNSYPLKVKIIGNIVLIGVVLLLAELTSVVLVNADIGAITKHQYRKPTVNQTDFLEYLKNRDNYLGWPSKGWLKKHTDQDESRVSPANIQIENNRTCVSIYGDSFAFGEEVDHDFAWGNLLAKRLNCRVKNFGVPGYGVGQSILRFEKNDFDGGELILLGLFPDNLNRMMNQWRHLLTGKNALGFKPSYSIDYNGRMVIHKLPVNNYKDYERLTERPESVLKNEMFLPGAPYFRARETASFPYSIFIGKIMLKSFMELDFKNVSKINSIRHLNYQSWYDTSQGPDAKKIVLFQRLMQYFSTVCRDRNKDCALVVIPDDEIIQRVQNGRNTNLDIFLHETTKEIEVIDPTNFLAKNMEEKGVCYFYGKKRDCSGHFNKEGYELFADAVYAWLANYSKNDGLSFGL